MDALVTPLDFKTSASRLQNNVQDRDTELLRRLVWLYFILLIFEGGLRKWFLPGLATPLLVVRDPLAAYIVFETWRRGLLPSTPYLYIMVITGVLAVFTSLILGHGNLWVTLFGARILLIHFPLMFAIGRLFTRADVIRIGKTTLFLAVPISILIAVQFYSPQSAWVNLGIGADSEGSGFSGAMGYFRPSATFSFTTGTTLLFGLVGAFILFFWTGKDKINKLLLAGSSMALLMAIPFSISRSLLFGVMISSVFTIIAVTRNPTYLKRTIITIAGVATLLAILLQVEIVQNALLVFTTRFEVASESEGGLKGIFIDRYLGGLIGALIEAHRFPFFGYGIGLGTNVGSMLMKGEVLYLISEGEWGRLIGELGAVMGMIVIALRLGFCVKVALAAYQKLIKGDLLPWILLSFGLLLIPQSQWGQPTTLGFSTLVGGLLLASLRVNVADLPTQKDKATCQ